MRIIPKIIIPNKNPIQKAKKIITNPQTEKNFIIFNKENANGLSNINYIPCMNSIIQCFAHIQMLTSKLLSSEKKVLYKSNKNKYLLTNAYIEILENLWQNKKIKYFTPEKFKLIINKMNPKFSQIGQINPKEFVLLIL